MSVSSGRQTPRKKATKKVGGDVCMTMVGLQDIRVSVVVSDGCEVRYEGEAKGDEVLVSVISKSQLRCLFCLRRNATKMTTLITMPIMIAIMTTKTTVLMVTERTI